MKYRILDDKGKVIAQFVNKADRDVCIQAMEEFYDDCTFTASDGE